MEIQIRKMTLTDLEAIENNLETNFDDFWTASIFRQELINENCYYLVALSNNEVVGFAGYMLILDEADITNIVVRKDLRNQKIGTKLLEALLSSIKSIKKIEVINLEVNENNVAALKLYEAFGFTHVGKRKNYYKNHQTALTMQKKVNFEN